MKCQGITVRELRINFESVVSQLLLLGCFETSRFSSFDTGPSMYLPTPLAERDFVLTLHPSSHDVPPSIGTISKRCPTACFHCELYMCVLQYCFRSRGTIARHGLAPRSPSRTTPTHAVSNGSTEQNLVKSAVQCDDGPHIRLYLHATWPERPPQSQAREACAKSKGQT